MGALYAPLQTVWFSDPLQCACQPAPWWASGFSTTCWGVFEHPRLSRLLRIVKQNGKRRSKAREKSFRNHSGHFLAQVKIEVTSGQNSKIFQNGLWTMKSLILKEEQRFYTIVFVSSRRVEPCILWPWKVKVKIWPQVKSGQGHSVTQVGQIILFDAPCGDKRNDSNPTSLSHLVLELLAKNCWWPRVTSMTFRGVTD